MRRLFWLALGVTLGVLIMRKVSAAVERLTPQGMADGVAGALRDLAASIGDFGAEVRAAMSEREDELRRTTGLDATPGGHTAPAPRHAQ